jgi:uncharacterized protein (TIGR02145 family)
MVRINSILGIIALGAIVMVSSCEQEKPLVGPSDNYITISASMESPENPEATKTSLGETASGNTPALWSASDVIKVYNGTGTANFTISTGAGEQSAVFEGTAPSGGDITSAIYPSSKASDAQDEINLPTVQTYKAGGVSDNTMPMYAQASGSALPFKNLCGIVKLRLTGTSGQKVTKIDFTSADNIAGTATITYNSGAPTLSFTSGQSKTIKLNCGEGIALSSTATDFYVVVPPTATDYFTVVVTLSSGEQMRLITAKDNKNIVSRSVIKSMPSKAFSDNRPTYTDEYDVSYKGIYAAGIAWAPVNCGYKAKTGDSGDALGYPYGKLYQWGRKYGQGYNKDTDVDATYPSGDNLVSSQVTNAVGNSADNKDKFYVNSDMETFMEWCSDRETSDPWLSDYNPCPSGWRVPSYEEMTNLYCNLSEPSFTTYNEKKGAWFDGTFVPDSKGVFLLNAGCRDYNGSGTSRENKGYYWSKSNYSGSISVFINKTSWAFINNEYSSTYFDASTRSTACSVRCISE